MKNPLKDWRLPDWLTAGGFVFSAISLLKGFDLQAVWNNLTPWKTFLDFQLMLTLPIRLSLFKSYKKDDGFGG